MASKEKLRQLAKKKISAEIVNGGCSEIQANRLNLPCETRVVYWLAGFSFLAVGALMAFQLSKVEDSLFYATDKVNMQLSTRLAMPYGTGDAKVHTAQVGFSEGFAHLNAHTSGEAYDASLDVSGDLTYDHKNAHVVIEPENTIISDIGQIGETYGQQMIGETDNQFANAFRAVVDFTTGESLARNNYNTKARQVVWSLPIFKVPSADRHVVEEMHVWAVLPRSDGIEFKLSDRRFGWGASIGGVMAFIAAIGLLLVWSNPDLGRR